MTGIVSDLAVWIDTHTCELQWFSKWQLAEVVASDARFPLLGIGLLLGRTLHIDYAGQKLTLT
jgi:hypothetical protein